jgi:hypothetical protein
MQITEQCVPWKVASGVENPVFQAWQFQAIGVCRKFQVGSCAESKSL